MHGFATCLEVGVGWRAGCRVEVVGGGGGFECPSAGAVPVADALQADWPSNRIICCGLTPHGDDIYFKVERTSAHTLATT